MTEEVGVLYQCIQCNNVFEKDKLSKVVETKCPECGFNVIRKARVGIAKIIATSSLSEEQRLLTSE